MSQAHEVVTPAAQRSATILLVEDDARLSGLLRDALTVEGYCLDVTSTGEQAWERLRGGDYDVVLCALALPGLDGPRLYQRLVETRPELVERLIFVSGYGCGEAEALVGPTRVPILRSPVQLEDLVQAVEDVLRPA